MPLTTPSTSSPDCDATGTEISTTTPAATSSAATVTTDAARAGGHPLRRRNRAGGQVSVVSSNAITSGQSTDHALPSSHSVTPAISRTRSMSSETRADVRSAARVFPGLNGSDMRSP
ncbi:hypothetical protein GCM10009558_067780 [Virgisporangium aurantiacum]